MNYTIYFNAKKLNSNDADAIAEYAKRLSAYCKINWYCKPAKSIKALPPFRKPSKHTLYVPVRTGETTPSSEELAEQINQINIQGISAVCFFIGYEDSTEQNDTNSITIPVLSLSSMTLSPGLTGVVLYEQLYRSYRILNGQPYHK